MRTPFDAELSNFTTHMGIGLVFKWSATPPPQGAGPSAPQFWGFLSIYAYTLYRGITKTDVVTYGEGACI